MINRTTKLTALLVAAASIASMTPVMAVEKLGNREGTIKEAIAFEDGKYVYEGYRTEDDDTGIWYNKGTEKDTFVEDLEEYSIKSKYGTKYAYVTEEGNYDDYLVDLTTGKVVDDESAEEKQDTAKAKLISNLKKTERYNDISDSNNKIQSDDVKEIRLFKNQFGDVWYQYATKDTATTTSAVTTDGAVASNGYFGDGIYTGFFNENGKYIDASYTANLRIYNTRKDKATLIEKYGKVYKDEAVRANLVSIKPLAQDKDYLYVLTTVDVDYFGLKAGSTTEYDFDTVASTVEQKFVQKISKAQGDKTDGAYLPKSVDSYQVDTKIFGDDDVVDALAALEQQDALYAVKNGVLYVTSYNSTDKEVTTSKLTLSKAKLDVDGSAVVTTGATSTQIAVANNKGEDIDTRVVKLDCDDSQDVENKLDSVSIDVDGNTWAIYKGKIMMFDGDEFKDQYSCDRSFDTIDVYNKGSLVAWDHEDNDAYTTVQEGKNQTVNDATEIDPELGQGGNNVATKTGWEQQADGTWVLYDSLGNKVTGWANVGGVWYYMNSVGTMQTGWVLDNGTWYYCNASGAMQTGWLNDNGTWYYLQANGAMKTGWLNDNGTWYYLQSSGAMKTGWLNDNGTWYYLNSNGSMAANTTVDGYRLGANGAWIR